MLEEKLVHRLFSHKILFVSRESRDYFQRHTGLPDSMLEILHNGLDLPDQVAAAPRSELGVPENRALIGFVGRISRGKGATQFLEMAADAARSEPDTFHFMVIGDGEGLSGHREQVRQLGLERDITFLGERRDIHRCYAALDCLVFCSEPGVEGMPGVVLEACAHGLPILARRTAPIEEIREYYDRILFLDGSEPPSGNLKAALAMPPADGSRLRAEFSIEAMRDRTLSLYNELLGRVTA
jgi:glycosyltransferase involved in cell wall biosynthesis